MSPASNSTTPDLPQFLTGSRHLLFLLFKLCRQHLLNNVLMKNWRKHAESLRILKGCLSIRISRFGIVCCWIWELMIWCLVLNAGIVPTLVPNGGIPIAGGDFELTRYKLLKNKFWELCKTKLVFFLFQRDNSIFSLILRKRWQCIMIHEEARVYISHFITNSLTCALCERFYSMFWHIDLLL